MITSLLGKLHLHDSSPQAARSVARAILHICFPCRPVDSFTRILHLSGYPQGRDMFTSPSVCKLYVDANGIRIIPRIGYVFLCKQYICHPSHLSTRAAPASPDSWSLIFHYNYLNPVSVRELPLPAPHLLSEQKKWY